MDKDKFIAYLDASYLAAANDLKHDHDEWDEAQMYLLGYLARIVKAGEFDE